MVIVLFIQMVGGTQTRSWVELVLPEYTQKNVLGQDVLEQYLPYVGRGDGGADGPAAQVQEG